MADRAGGAVLGLVGALGGADGDDHSPVDVNYAGAMVYLTQAGVISPTYGSFTPAAGAALTAMTPITFDETGTYASLAFIVADFPELGIREVVWDGTAFGRQYQGPNNSRTAISGGFTFSLLREGGWPASPTLLTYTLAPVM